MRKGLSERNQRKDGVKRIDLSKAQLKVTKVTSSAKVTPFAKVTSFASAQKQTGLSKAKLKETKVTSFAKVASPAKVASLVSEQMRTDSTKKPKAKLVKETYPQKAFKNSLPTNHKNKVNSRTDSMNSLSTNSIVSPIKPKANFIKKVDLAKEVSLTKSNVTAPVMSINKSKANFIKNVNPIKEVYPRKPYTNSSEPNRKKGKNPQPSKK